MYPTISDLLKDLFGFYLPLPIQTFGFMLAISFVCAAWTLQTELKRYATNGWVKPSVHKVLQGEPASTLDLFFSFLGGFVLGYKLLFVVFNYSWFVEDTQGILLSSKGNFVGGLAVGGLFAYMRYREKEQQKLPEPKLVEEVVTPEQLTGNLTMAAAISGVLGAKIFHILENLDAFFADPAGMFFAFSGLTMYGGLVFGTITVIWYARKHGIQPLQIADMASPGVMLAYGTGRLGCHLAGDGDWGIVNLNPKPGWLSWLPDWAWAYNYPGNVINDGIPMPGCEGHHCMVLPDAVYPTPLYEAIACIGLFFLLWRLRFRLKAAGSVFFLYLLLNGIERMFIEQIRINNRFNVLGLSLTQAEIIAGILILTGLIGFIIVNKRKELTHGA